MKYMIKEGILYDNDSHQALVKMKSSIIGSEKKIYEMSGSLALEASIKTEDGSGDVRKHEYLLTDSNGKLVCSAHPDFADGDDPYVTGWPVCRMPKVDHANVKVQDKDYVLTMHNSQNYSLTDSNHTEKLNIMHKGISGGWILDDKCDLSPELLCGIFAFCRYIEQENEFLIV